MELKLRYSSPAPDSDEGWENYSLPIGCSYFGANVFGGTEYERIQITENSLENPDWLGGLSSFADIFIRFRDERVVRGYERGLDLDHALAYVGYSLGETKVHREYFASYPDRVLVGKISSSSPLSYDIELSIPFLTEEEHRVKRGNVSVHENDIIISGTMEAYNIHYAGVLRVFSDGEVSQSGGSLRIERATSTYYIFSPGTNYELTPHVFLEKDNKKKLRDFDPLPAVISHICDVSSLTYDELKTRHEADYTNLFGRVKLDIGSGETPDLPTDELLGKYSEGERCRYLEILYFQFGRYLLISSSRPGGLPANLQGVWNCHDRSPWGSGYWHNINVQMNYWPAFVTNLSETFEAYRAFNEAFRPAAEEFAREYIKKAVPEKYTGEPGGCGWTIGTGNYAYSVSGPGGHSGPGTGGLTSKLFWEAYAFTGSEEILKNVTYPALLSMTKHLLRVVREYDGLYLSAFSASPEQIIANNWSNPVQYYHTIGCAFDQQMILENALDFLKCVKLIGEENIPEKDLPVIKELREQIEKYDPVQVGWSGQIKEYREEKFYGEVGEYRHRHISELVGLYPGTTINTETPAWLDAAKATLNYRSDESTGWALAHRLNAWARTGDGNRAYRLFSNLLGMRTLPNLWDTHPPFQIDGNLGGTSGVAEMLLQSHESYIHPLPCIPDEWESGEYSGLVARGGFEVSVKWKDGSAYEVKITSLAGNTCRLKTPNISKAVIPFSHTVTSDDHIEFETEAGQSYRISDIPKKEKKPAPEKLHADRDLLLTWDFDEPVSLWRAVDSSPVYEPVAKGIMGGVFRDTEFDFGKADVLRYKITRADSDSPSAPGAVAFINHSTPAERQRYRYLVKQLNLVSEDTDQESLEAEIHSDDGPCPHLSDELPYIPGSGIR